MISFPIRKKPTVTHWFEYRRDYNKENIKKFHECISSLSFYELNNKTNVNEAFNQFHDLITLFHGLCFPLVKFKNNNLNNNRNKWKTKGIKKSSVTKRKLYLAYKYSKGNNKVLHKLKYDKYSHVFKKCIYKSQQKSNQSYILNSDNICKATWNTINSNVNLATQLKNIDIIIQDDETITNPDIICELFNIFLLIQLT